MHEQIQTVRRVRFGDFVADFEQRELLKGGRRLPLRHKPFRILEMLLRRPGSLVTRQELARELWPELHISYEQSLNTAVNSLRLALGDSPRDSRFIETRSGLGYRFIAPIAEFEDSDAAMPEADSPAHHDYLKGRYFLNKMTSGDTHKAIAYFEAALRERKDCAAAHAGMADAYSQMALHGAARASQVCQQARNHAAAALAANPRFAEAHVAMARVKMTFDWDWNGAHSDCLRALQLKPQLAEAHGCFATLQSICGAHDQAVSSALRASVLDPLSMAVGTALAFTLYLARDYRGAEEQCWKVLTLEPRFAYAQTILGVAYEAQGEYAEAITELENARSASDNDPSVSAAIGHTFAVSKNRTAALETLQRLRSASCYWRAIVHCGLGEHSQAIEALEQACRERDPLLLWLKVDPRLDCLHDDSAFQRLLQRVGL